MNMLTTLLAFLFALGLLVFIHELGHYLVARWCGVKVLRFSIGFGKPFLRWTVGADRTEWTLAPIPLGGYVRMLDEREGSVPEAELSRAFNRQSLGRRSLIVLAGPLFNFLLAILLYAALGWHGLPEPAAVVGQPPAQTVAAAAGFQAGDRIEAIDGHPIRTFNETRLALIDGLVDRSVVPVEVKGSEGAVRSLRLDLSQVGSDALERDFMQDLGLELAAGRVTIGQIVPGSPAEQAGLRAGDQLVQVDGTAVARARGVIEQVGASAGRALAITVQRGEQESTFTVVPRLDAEHGGAYRIGAALNQNVAMITPERGPLESIAYGAQRTWEMSIFSLRMLGKMVTGQLSWRNLSGPVAIADYAGQSVQVGWFAYMAFLALISVSLGVLNLLPIPVLDGGHLVYYALEAIKGRPLSDRFMMVTQRVGVVLVASLMIVALFNDLTRLIS